MNALSLRILLLFVAISSSAHCQVEMRLEMSAKVVELGQPIGVSLTAQSPQGGASDPKLVVPPTFGVSGPNVGTSMQVSFVNGSMVKSSGLTAHWNIQARRVGKFTIGPASIEAGGSRYQSRTTTIEIVAQGTLPQTRPNRRRSGFPPGFFDPSFDPFGNMPGMPSFDDLLPDQQPTIPEYPPEFASEAALDPVAFLRATVTPTRVFVGQQVRLRVFAYGSRGPFQEVSSQDATRPDFFSQPVVNAPAQAELYRVPIGDNVWYAAKIRDLILFPLRSGDLQIGAMEFGFGGPRYAQSSPGVVRRSQPLVVTVAEPPVAGRPAGYQLGDVGTFRLSAEVSPREIEAGGAISAVVTLTGVGNLPPALHVPARTGVDFLTPTVRSVASMSGDLYGGSKVFTYVIRLDQAGTIDLGDITLPYFDPNQQRYEIARATLGRVVVKPGHTAAAIAPAPPSQSGLEKLLQSLAPRQTLTPFSNRRAYLTDTPLSWLLLLAGPLAVLLLQAGLRLGRAASAWRVARRDSPTRRIAEQLDVARSAVAANNSAVAASALERALYLTLEAHFDVRARGLLRAELENALVKKAIPVALCAQVLACLDACDGARFAQDNESAMRDLVTTVAQLTGQLQALGKPSRSTPRSVASEEGAAA